LGVLYSYVFGASLGALTLLLEGLLAPGFPSSSAFAAYSILGGLSTVGARAFFRLLGGPQAGRRGWVVTALAWPALIAVYFVNVELLPGEHYLSAKSLAADTAVGLVLGLAAALALRTHRFDHVRARHPRAIAVAATLVLCTTACTAAVSALARVAPHRVEAGSGPDVLWIVLDSARADHLSLYGYGRPTSPALEALASRARVYEHAFSAATWTVPSVSAVLLANVEARGGSPLTEKIGARGYASACFSDNPHFRSDAALLRGFDLVESGRLAMASPLRGTVVGEVLDRLRPASDERLTDRALRWMEAQPGPYFLHVQLMDSHTPYRHPRIDGKQRSGRHIEFPFSHMSITEDEAEDIVARYDGGIRSAQAQAARIVEAAYRRGRPFVAIVTADHGECLGEHGRWFHGVTYAPELVHVPLLVFGTGVVPGRVSAAVGHESVRRTMLNAAGIPCTRCMGIDLRTGTGQEQIEGGLPPEWRYRIQAGYKLVAARHQAPQLFDVAADPTERDDLAAHLPATVAAMGAGLDAQGPTTGANIEELRALGYVGL
jgi:hypothetical protein